MEPARDNSPSSGPGEWVVMYDAEGRESMRVPREEFRDTYLPRVLAYHWDDPDGLFNVITVSIEDGFEDRLVEAVDHLYELEESARSAILRAVVRTRIGRFEEAEVLLRRFLVEKGPDAYVLSNLAKVFSAKRQEDEAESILWESLRLDPDQDNALQWWALAKQDQFGHDAYTEALERVERELGGWRATLLLGRRKLKDGDLEGAVDRFRRVLDVAGDRSDVLFTVSGDLGLANRENLVLELVLPRFDPQRHDPRAGFNLVSALRASGRMKEARSLLARVRPWVQPQQMEILRALEQQVGTRPRS